MPNSYGTKYGFTKLQVEIIRNLVRSESQRPVDRMRQSQEERAWPMSQLRTKLGKPDSNIAPGNDEGTFSLYDTDWTDTTKNLENVVDLLGVGALTSEMFELRFIRGVWCFIPLGVLTRKAKVTETTAITAGSSGDVEIYTIAGSATGYTVIGYLDWAEGGVDLDNGKECFITFMAGRWMITGAEC